MTLRIANVQQLEQRIIAAVGARPSIRMGLSISGPAAAYALVWEWGSARLTKPGPKTTWGVNPDGEVVILTLTAPYGYIRVHKPEFRKIIREEISRVSWSRVKLENVGKRLEQAITRAAVRCKELIADAAPYDTGELMKSIEIAQIGPETLDTFTVRPRLAF